MEGWTGVIGDWGLGGLSSARTKAADIPPTLAKPLK